MQDWIVTTLTAVKQMAQDRGFDALSDEMDIAILVAAEEYQSRDFRAAGGADVEGVERNRGQAVVYPEFGGLRRYH